jgi:hypothetical protein
MDTMSDPMNCGGCGIQCGMNAPNCVVGACSKCNPNILVIADSQTAVNKNMGAALKAAGFRPNVVDNGATAYTGMPATAGFGAVFVVPGNSYMVDMPMQGQMEIVNGQMAGVGIVLDGLAAFEVSQMHYNGLKNLMLLSGLNGQYSNYTVSPVGPPTAPFFAGLGGFSEANTTLWFPDMLINNAMVVGQFNFNGTPPAEVIRPMPQGRIVQFAYGVNYQAGANQWTNDANMTLWTLNGIRWAAGCAN